MEKTSLHRYFNKRNASLNNKENSVDKKFKSIYIEEEVKIKKELLLIKGLREIGEAL